MNCNATIYKYIWIGVTALGGCNSIHPVQSFCLKDSFFLFFTVGASQQGIGLSESLSPADDLNVIKEKFYSEIMYAKVFDTLKIVC